ncbi:rod-binding protein [bacterium]|nr:rod-binding protein [bacterium]
MGLIEPTKYGIMSGTLDADQQAVNNIRENPSNKEQLKKVAKEFESIFISKMFSVMDESIDRDNGIFGQEAQYSKTFKSYMFNELGRNLASNPRTSFGFAKQIYEQMEKYVGK